MTFKLLFVLLLVSLSPPDGRAARLETQAAPPGSIDAPTDPTTSAAQSACGGADLAFGRSVRPGKRRPSPTASLDPKTTATTPDSRRSATRASRSRRRPVRCREGHRSLQEDVSAWRRLGPHRRAASSKPDGTPITNPVSWGLLTKFGTNVPTAGKTMLALSSGAARAPDRSRLPAPKAAYDKGYTHATPPGQPQSVLGVHRRDDGAGSAARRRRSRAEDPRAGVGELALVLAPALHVRLFAVRVQPVQRRVRRPDGPEARRHDGRQHRVRRARRLDRREQRVALARMHAEHGGRPHVRVSARPVVARRHRLRRQGGDRLAPTTVPVRAGPTSRCASRSGTRATASSTDRPRRRARVLDAGGDVGSDRPALSSADRASGMPYHVRFLTGPRGQILHKSDDRGCT